MPPVGRISVYAPSGNEPDMQHWWKGSVHHTWWGFIDLLCGERDKGGTAPPLSIPAAPRGNRCCALRSPPACLTAAGSTRHPVSVRLCPPSMASRPCHSRFGSPISAGVNTTAVRWMPNEKQSLLEPHRPDKAQPPSGNVTADKMPDGAGAYPAYGNGAGLYAAIRQSVARC